MKALLLIFYSLYCFTTLYAQKSGNISYVDIERGLSNNQVRSITQDHRGFMWFATKDGLNRYNGYTFDVFRKQVDNSSSLSHNILTAVTNDRQHRLWAATRQGVCIYNDTTNTFMPVDHLPYHGQHAKPLQEVIRTVQTDKVGNMLIASEGLGLLYCQSGHTARQIPLIIEGKKNLTYGVPCLTIAPNGTVWVFVQKIGLCVLRYDKMCLELINEEIKLAVSMEADDQYLYIGSYRGLLKFDVKQQKLEKVFLDKFDQGVLTVNCLTWRTADELWIGTAEAGIFIYHAKQKEAQAFLSSDQKNLSSYGYIYSIYVDYDARVWIGTSISGVLIVDPNKKKFRTLTPGQLGTTKSSQLAISSFMEDGDHNLYVGTENDGLYIWHPNKGFYRHFLHDENKATSLSSNSVTSILQDNENAVWIGTFNAGINRYHSANGTFERFRCINPSTGIENKVIRRLYKDRHGNFWATTLRQGTLTGGLYRFNYQSDSFQLFDDRLSDFFSFTEDRQGTLWGGNLTELVKIDTAAKNHRFFPIHYTVTSIYEDRGGHFWVGTEGGGLFLFDRERFQITKRYTTENGLSNNAVLSILEDEQSNLWMSTYNGLMKFDPKREQFLYYYQSDGLQSNQFQLCAADRLASGAFVFGGIKGFNLFMPAEITTAQTSPALHFTQVAVDGKVFPFMNTPIVLPYNQAALSFQFAALEYSAPDKIQYAYYMEGWDKTWNYAGNNRIINYNRMAEGSYVLHIRCTNSEGIWMDSNTRLAITILPPWYRSWWAYLLYAVTAAALLSGYLLYRTRQTRLQYEVKVSKLDALRKKAEYDAEVVRHEKDLIAFEQERLINEKEKELNEKRISFFTNISHEFRTPLTLIINPIKELLNRISEKEVRNELDIMYRSARRMLNLVDQLLLFRKVEAGYEQLNNSYFNFHDLCEEVYLYFIQQAQTKHIIYDFFCPNKELYLVGDRDKLEMVFFNLISNALKYTSVGGRVRLNVVEMVQELIIEVSDTGCGISAQEGDKLFERFYQTDYGNKTGKLGFGIGLYLAKQFVELHGGSLTYQSALGNGTTFKVVLVKQDRQPFEAPPIAVHSVSSLPDHSLISNSSEAVELDLNTTNLNQEFISDKRSLLVVDDDADIRNYIKNIFKSIYTVYEAEDGEEGLAMVRRKLPDLIITDYKMGELDGISFCQQLKNDTTFSNIPVILLTANTGKDVQLKSLDSGADDFLTKPFETDYLVARVANLLQNRNYLQNYFYNEITLQFNTVVISEEYKKFLDRCIEIVEQHLTDTDFGIQALAAEIGMSHSNLYKRVKSISGQSVSAFIRFIRLRKAAQLLIDTDCNVTEAAFRTGFNDPKYFSKQFTKLFRSSPSEFIRKHRVTFAKHFKVQKKE
ncbi:MULTISPECIES: hybrid sensor histidine kinase/response regulator [Olivibacter]|uniref:histidine kinase n=1 Tax=Olivibacter jilunii TaxID=985016 RepID=A0ABW6B006_9SPHI|nr:response regulator [Olivibacter sp. UJ_SKK_5.1]MDX3915563.1 two-component regulator propeller domain-containing protein [Pseudosphingobacterium sp.]